jgi:hypothetical protein
MSWMKRARNLYQLLFQRHKLETELDDEAKAYFEILADRYVEEGMSRERGVPRGAVEVRRP